ncbi:MAG: phosphate ABC transporter permease PstA [Dehalococcoidia bacterium]|nr:phosphate ABC transporter permease PstA [Dehalococcoidia bacterium]MSQ17471.1 phosphate ABC transporter permease PstA [Dehalococcoidia bacterium]
MTRRQWEGRAFHGLCLLAVAVALAMLVLLLVYLARQGLTRVSWEFITSFPSRDPDQAGIKAALLGSIYVVAIAAVVAFTLGVSAAIYLEEYAVRNWRSRIIQVNITNLAGVPSIVYGILGLEIFVRTLGLGRSVLAGGLTMALLVLPIIIIAAQEAIRAVPPSLREGAYALGATRWQAIWHLVLPQAMPGILTGVILAVSRALGETAPLIVMGALTFVPFAPDGPLSRFTVLPIQIFNWTSRPQAGFHEAAAAGIIVLLALLLTMNAAAIVLRNKFQRRPEG